MKNVSLSTSLRLLVLSILFLLSEKTTAQNNIPVTQKKYVDTEAQIEAFKKKGMEIYNKSKTDPLWSSYLRDSVVLPVLNTFIDNYQFVDYKNTVLSTATLQKPIFLQVGGRTCKPCMAELPALNAIVEKYADSVHFILLMQGDSEATLQNNTSDYHKKISLIPSRSTDTVDIKGYPIIGGFKHLLRALPTTYLIGSNKEIRFITQGAHSPGKFKEPNGTDVIVTKEDAFEKNYTELDKALKQLLSN